MSAPWRRLAVAVSVVTFVASACTSEQPPPVNFDPAPTFNADLTRSLSGRPFKLLPRQVLFVPPVGLEQPLGYIHQAWADYAEGFHSAPANFRAHELVLVQRAGKESPVPACLVPPDPGKSSVFYCIASGEVDGATGVVVLPVGFTTRLDKALASNPDNLLLDVIAAVEYTSHLGAELLPLGWPTGQWFNWCIAGVSLRALTSVAWDDTRMTQVLAAFTTVMGFEADGRNYVRSALVKRGYQSGQPLDCVYGPSELEQIPLP